MRFDQLSLEYKTIVWAQDGDEMAEAEEVSKKFEEFNDLLELAVDAYEDETSAEDKIETLEDKPKSELTKYKGKREEAKKNVQFNFDKIRQWFWQNDRL